MSRVFLISDTHWNHKNILKFEPVARPFPDVKTHNERLILNWNQTVNPEDIVFHGGDVCFGGDFSMLYRLNGKKQLILGNHDEWHKVKRYIDMDVFETIQAQYNITNDIILTHYPVHESQVTYRYKANIHGHVHSKSLKDKRYFNISCEAIGLKPILLDDIISEFKKRGVRL